MSEEVKCSYCGSKEVFHRDGDIVREFPGGYVYRDYYTCETCGQYFHIDHTNYDPPAHDAGKE